jgi:hypothetical protein
VVGTRIKGTRTVAQALQENRWVRDIAGALTVQVIMEYLLVWDLTRNIQLDTNRPDTIRRKWTADKSFSTASAYHAFFFIGQFAIPGAKVLRKARAPAKCKFFVWLVLHDRCWTGDRRKRHNLQDDDLCALCNQLLETITHLLLARPTSGEVWFKTLRRVDWQAAVPTGQSFVFKFEIKLTL